MSDVEEPAQRGRVTLPDRCLGTMYFGTTVPEPDASAVLDRYLERGGRWLDTANNYAAWVDGGTGDESEELLGRWMADRGCRDDVLVATKVGARSSVRGGRDGEADGLSLRAIRRQVEGSLRRLDVERIDLLYAGIDDRGTPLLETLASFDALVRAGLVGAVACSGIGAERLREALTISRTEGFVGYQAVQVPATYLTRAEGADLGGAGELTDQLRQVADEHRLRVVGCSALLSGAYGGRRAVPEEYRHHGTDHQLAAVGEVAGRVGLSGHQVVLAWLAARGVLPALGVSRVAQLDEALDVEPGVLDDAALALLDAARG